MRSPAGTNDRHDLSAQARTWKSNVWRREEYRVEGRVELRRDENVFVRRAANRYSAGFLSEIHKRERFAAHAFGGKADVISGDWDEDRLVYPYLEEPTLEEKVSEAMDHGDESHGLTLVNQYVAFVRSLPSTFCIPSAFYDFIKYPMNGGPLECLTFGPYDCIPRNIIVDDSRWKIIDLEWTFDFPIPVEFVLWRGVRSLLHNLQGDIQAHVTKRDPAVLLCGYGHTRVYMPYSWFKAFNVAKMDLKKYALFEWLFNQQVHIRNTPRPARLRCQTAKPRLYAHIPTSRRATIILEQMARDFLPKVKRLATSKSH